MKLTLPKLFTTVFIIFALGVALWGWQVTRDKLVNYMQGQVYTHMRDASTALATGIGYHLRNDDPRAAEMLVRAFSDSGYYGDIRFVDLNGSTQFSRQFEVPNAQYPAWFENALPLPKVAAEAEVLNGWQQVGTVQVSALNVLILNGLWQYASAFLGFVLVLTVIITAFTYVIARKISRYLLLLSENYQRTKPDVRAINHSLGFFTELKSLDDALNSYNTAIEYQLDRLKLRIKRHKREALSDSLLGIGNRRAFELDALNNFNFDNVNDEHTAILITFSKLQQLNQDAGYQSGDHFLVACKDALLLSLKEFPDSHIYRTSGAGIVIIMNAPASYCKEHVTEINTRLANLTDSKNQYSEHHIALSSFDLNEKASDILKRLDNSQTIDNDEEAPLIARGQWRDVLQTFCDQPNLPLQFQPVLNQQDGKALYHEAFCFFEYQGKPVPNNLIFSIAHKLNVAKELDKAIIRRVYTLLKRQPDLELAVNISAHAIKSHEFIAWLSGWKDNKRLANRLTIEIKERSLLDDQSVIIRNLKAMKDTGFKLCIDGLGENYASLKLIDSVHFDFVKVNARILFDNEHTAISNSVLLFKHQKSHIIVNNIDSAHAKKAAKENNFLYLQGIDIYPERILYQHNKEGEFNFFNVEFNSPH